MNCDVPESYKAPMSHHTSPEEVGRVFAETRPKLGVFTHVIQFHGVSLKEMMDRTRKEYDGSFVMGEDLMSFIINEN
jgi:ribonuclease Z